MRCTTVTQLINEMHHCHTSALHGRTTCVPLDIPREKLHGKTFKMDQSELAYSAQPSTRVHTQESAAQGSVLS